MHKDSQIVVPLTTTSTKTFYKLGNDSYKLVTQKMKWDEARRQCQADDSDLASILNPGSQAFITLQMYKHNEPVWIGLNNNVVKPKLLLHKCADVMPLNELGFEDLKSMKAISAVYKPSSTLVIFSFLQTQGKFQWVDNWKLSFTKWGMDEPKNNYGCVYMDVDRKWKTAPCSETHYSLCKKSPGQTILQFDILHDIL